MRSMKEFHTGWTIEPGLGIYHFTHIDRQKAEALIEAREQFYVVETINSTFGDNDRSLLHHNLYFCGSLSQAIAMATRHEINAQEIAEEVVGIRPATPAELKAYFRVFDYYEEHMPAALSEEAANELPG